MNNLLYNQNGSRKREFLFVLIVLLFVTLLVAMITIKNKLATDKELLDYIHTEKITSDHVDSLDYRVLSSQTYSVQEISKKTGLTTLEIKNLINIREQEKLAEDLYFVFSERWGEEEFSSILVVEEELAQDVNALFQRYLLVDVSNTQERGTFLAPDIEKLYLEFKTQGEQSLIESYKAMTEVEELHVKDLMVAISLTNKQDIIAIYEKLLDRSKKHLRSHFTKLKENNQQYLPQHLSIEEFTTIINEQ